MSALDKKQKCIVIFFLSLPLIDLLTSLSARFIDFPITIGIVVRGLSLGISVIYVLFCSQNKYKKHALLYIIGVAVFAGVYLLTKPDIWTVLSLITEVTSAFKYMYFPIMMICLYIIFHDFEIEVATIKRILLINCFVYTALLLIPYLTHTNFSSYDWNFTGNTGWFYAANEIGSILTVLSIAIFDLMDNKKKWKVFLAIPIIYSITTIGTKVSYLGIIISVLVTIVIFVLNEKRERYLLPAILFTILMVCCLGSVTIKNIDKLAGMDTLPPSTEIETEIPDTEIGDDETPLPQTTADFIRSNKILNLVNRFTSNRVLYFLENYKFYARGGLATLLFGLGWAPRTAIEYTYYKPLVEVDILDILLHYGIVGFCIYFIPFAFLIYKYIKKIKKIQISSYAYLLAAMLGMGISCIAGHILGAPSISIYLVLLLLIVIRQTETSK